jgi:hypothetical protein
MAKRGEKIDPETVDQVRALRLEGKSFGTISKEIGISKSTVAGLCRDITNFSGTENRNQQQAETGGLPPSSQHTSRVPNSDEVVDTTNELRLLELKVAKSKAQQQLDLLQQEADLRQEERQAVLDERRQRLILGSMPASADTPEVEAARRGLAEIEVMREELAIKRQELEEAKREMEIGSLKEMINNQKQSIDDLNFRLEGKDQIGRGQWDVISEAMIHVSKQLDSLGANFFAFLQSSQNKERFNPERLTPEARQAEGERIAKWVEREAELTSVESQGLNKVEPHEVTNSSMVTPEAKPRIAQTNTRLVDCARCGATQEIDIIALKLALEKDGKPRSQAFATCQNPSCSMKIDISDLVSDMLQKSSKTSKAPPFNFE